MLLCRRLYSIVCSVFFQFFRLTRLYNGNWICTAYEVDTSSIASGIWTPVRCVVGCPILRSSLYLPIQVACVQFLNIVVHSPEDINLRVYLQYELHLLGWDTMLKVCACLGERLLSPRVVRVLVYDATVLSASCVGQ